jgi:hypothetical protein
MDSTVTKRIRYQFPFKTIIQDVTGEITGLGANSWAINDAWAHNKWDGECDYLNHNES